MTFKKRLKLWCVVANDWLNTEITFDRGWGVAIVLLLLVQAFTL